MSLAAQTYLVSQLSEAYYRSHLFVKIHDELEVVDDMYIPSVVTKELYLEAVRKKWYKKGTSELTITNRKIFNLEFVKSAFPRSKSIVLDIGPSKSSLVEYQDGVFKVKEEEVGMGQGLFNLLVSPRARDDIYSFIPVETDRAQVFDYLAEKTLYPARLPATPLERMIELAATMYIIRQFAQRYERQFLPARETIPTKKSSGLGSEISPTGVVILTGEVFWSELVDFNKFNLSGMALLSLLHGSEMRGIWSVYHDGSNLVPALGRLQKEGIISTSIGRYIKLLGTVIVLNHNLPEGKDLGTLEFDLGYAENQKLQVQSGQIIRLPYDSNSVGSLSIDLNDQVEIAGLSGAQLAKKPEIVGGSLGIIIDARQRPFDTRKPTPAILSQWLEGVDVKV